MVNKLKRGYSAPEELREMIQAAHRTAPLRTAGTALGDGTLIVGASVIGGMAVTRLPVVAAVLVAALCSALVARASRGLENLIHEGSHFNWCRHHRGLNDAMVRLAALPVGADLGAYREGHLRHHGRFGTDDDPDFARYRELSLEQLDRSSSMVFLSSLSTRFLRYQQGWLREVAAGPGALLSPLGTAALLIVAPSWWTAGGAVAAGAGVTWLVGFGIVLPGLRLVAEASEHIYTGADNAFDATISNLGWWQRVLLHPHNDGYHTLHHMWPGIPHHRIRTVHDQLMRDDPNGYGARLRYRTGVRQHPVPVLDTPPTPAAPGRG